MCLAISSHQARAEKFADTLAQEPKCARFLTEFEADERKQTNLKLVTINDECSMVMQNELSSKLQDPWSFYVPYVIGSMLFDKALCDIRSCINLMSYSLAMKLGIKTINQLL